MLRLADVLIQAIGRTRFAFAIVASQFRPQQGQRVTAHLELPQISMTSMNVSRRHLVCTSEQRKRSEQVTFLGTRSMYLAYRVRKQGTSVITTILLISILRYGNCLIGTDSPSIITKALIFVRISAAGTREKFGCTPRDVGSGVHRYWH